MNEIAELLEYLRIVELKLKGITQDIQNIRARLEPKPKNAPITFFEALSGEDKALPSMNGLRNE